MLTFLSSCFSVQGIDFHCSEGWSHCRHCFRLQTGDWGQHPDDEAEAGHWRPHHVPGWTYGWGPYPGGEAEDEDWHLSRVQVVVLSVHSVIEGGVEIIELVLLTSSGQAWEHSLPRFPGRQNTPRGRWCDWPDTGIVLYVSSQATAAQRLFCLRRCPPLCRRWSNIFRCRSVQGVDPCNRSRISRSWARRQSCSPWCQCRPAWPQSCCHRC